MEAAIVTKVESLIAEAAGQKARCVLVTSGGTSVPLEKNTVRYGAVFNK